MNYDKTFITNQDGETLKERFKVLIKDTRFFDCLVGYFYTSGFFALSEALEKTEKVRILVGIGTSKKTLEQVEEAMNQQTELPFSHAETKKKFSEQIINEMEETEDERTASEGVNKFVEWIRSGKLEIRAYPSERIHAKLYIMTFIEGDKDTGRVITGSSNFSEAGLVDNLEFNVELKNKSDYEFALNKFNELWKDSVELNEKYVETINTKTWLNDTLNPYDLYLKLLYEYFKDELNQQEDLFTQFFPEGYKELFYQTHAVLNAKKIVEEYNGVFISDVVGLGKTYVAARLAGHLTGRTLVLAPPVLLNKNNPGSWPNVFQDFHVSAEFESVGKFDDVIERGTEKYSNVIIDEAHRFRTESNITYEKLAQICAGKKVILVTATPYNNLPKDILSQIKLFQKPRKSDIPNLPDLENFFGRLEKKLLKIDKEKNYTEYLETVRENAKEIREKVLKYLMVRRTRTEISKYFADDLIKNNVKFPTVEKPEPLFYLLNKEEDRIFYSTLTMIARKFKYSRYTPLLYLKDGPSHEEALGQTNMRRFMNTLLVKRLESSFYAFKLTIKRFFKSYQRFIEEFDNGSVYISKKYSEKIFDLLENDDDEMVLQILEFEEARKLSSDIFKPEFREDLQNDLDILSEINEMWESIRRDPKLDELLKELKKNPILRNKKILLFTESKETAEYVAGKINEAIPGKALCYTGGTGASVRDDVIDNFDARARSPKDDYRILVSTEVLSEGVNLHRSNIVINYDIPWNPTRMMQRVGRINRVDSRFDKIYTFNFFPTEQSENIIGLTDIAKRKIHAFLTLLGGDASLLTEDEPVDSHNLFDRLLSAKTITGEDEFEESELKYLNVIKNVRDEKSDLFEKIKRLPKKAKTGRANPAKKNSLLTYFRKGKLQKFYLCSSADEAAELDFFTAAQLMEVSEETARKKIPDIYFDLLEKNKETFKAATAEEQLEFQKKGGPDNAAKIWRILKVTQKNKQRLTDDQESFLEGVIKALEEGTLPKFTLKKTLQELEALGPACANPIKVIGVLQICIPKTFLEKASMRSGSRGETRREVILSEFFTE